MNALGENGRCLALLGEAEARARALDDRARLGRVLAQMAQVLRVTGDNDGAIAAGRQALELAAVLGDSALQAQASISLGQAYHASGDYGRAAELLRWSVETADGEAGTPRTDVQIRSQALLALTLSALGAFAEGRRHGEEALRLATLAGRGDTPIVVHTCLGRLYLRKGTWSTPSGCSTRAWPSVVPLATGTGCGWLQRAWAMPLRSGGASRRDAHCWRRRSAKLSAWVRW